MTSPRIDLLRSRPAPLRDAVTNRPAYARIDGIASLRLFMEHHAFAARDFMSLLKAVQHRACCVDVTWTPPADPAACRLVDRIVLGEESDEDGRGGHSESITARRPRSPEEPEGRSGDHAPWLRVSSLLVERRAASTSGMPPLTLSVKIRWSIPASTSSSIRLRSPFFVTPDGEEDADPLVAFEGVLSRAFADRFLDFAADGT